MRNDEYLKNSKINLKIDLVTLKNPYNVGLRRRRGTDFYGKGIFTLSPKFFKNNVMRVYESQYMVMDYYEEHKLLELTWLPSTEFMSEEDYKQAFIDFMNTTIKYQSKLVLPDETNLGFSAKPSLQEWVNKNVFTEITKHKCNLYSAIVLKDDIIAKLAVEQLLDETEALEMTKAKFFIRKNDAKNWLLSRF